MNPTKQPSELRSAIAGLNPYFKKAAGYSFLTSILILAPSGYMLEVYDRVINSRSHMTLAMLTLLVLAVYAVMEILDWVRSEIMHEATLVFDQQLGGRVFNAIFMANLRRLPGGNAQPISDLKTVSDFLQSQALLAAMEVPVAFIVLILLFVISPVLGWFALIGAIAQTGVGWLNERSTQQPLLQANRSAAAAQHYADSVLRNSQVIASMGMLPEIRRRWNDQQKSFLKFQAIASDEAGTYQSISKFIQNTVSSMLLGLGAWLLLRDQLAGGAAYMIVGSLLGGRAIAPLIQIVAQWPSVVKVRESYVRLDALLTAVPSASKTMTLPLPKGHLTVEHLIAGAPTVPGSPNPSGAILKGLNFTLSPGEVLAVIGPSASGKSTLAKLLVGVWPSMSGKVRLDGSDVHAWNKAELGPSVGYLPQGVELLDGSLADNIARFGVIDPSKLDSVALAVGLGELIASLPEGFNSPVGSDGAMLSGGQRQRVGLARALYNNPTFVVLDEPNSNLDEQGDAALARAILMQKKQGTTFVIMTHRTSIFHVVDKLLVLKEGQALLFGPRDEVLKAMKDSASKPNASAASTT